MDPSRPFIVKEQPGTKYYCACARSKNRPWCDGSHKGSGQQPYKVEIEVEKNVAICSCALSARMPFCDGAHRSLG
ncbi:CDGSH iron-sulfur domain-containing protein [Chlorobium sp.]|jgi:CDGSH iron-sulfur domain-containing protein 3|uniref:CDGSH iron-sulfur domain-containing protein n=1 Tax=Chlorobium sp. TaxID=1095 RepID=UPI003C4AB489|nr:CDGSH iron-sulfur domain-containing protein [Chlorobiaceae bacterium]NTW94745.1 CDGSH iron-sulfur domain-containing protein [Chlorobiaceae bacterium]